MVVRLICGCACTGARPRRSRRTRGFRRPRSLGRCARSRSVAALAGSSREALPAGGPWGELFDHVGGGDVPPRWASATTGLKLYLSGPPFTRWLCSLGCPVLSMASGRLPVRGAAAKPGRVVVVGRRVSHRPVVAPLAIDRRVEVVPPAERPAWDRRSTRARYRPCRRRGKRWCS